MKYLITCLVVAALAGCEQVSDSTGQVNEQTTAADAPVTTTESTAETAPEAVVRALPMARFVRTGLYKAVREGKLLDDAETSTGKKLGSLTMEYVRQADRIPLVKGTYMGLQYRIFSLPPELEEQSAMDLRRVLIHPEMTLPDGSKSTGSDFMIKRRIKVGQVMAYDAYGLHEDYELVEGDWTFQYWYGDRMLLEHTFTTYWPEEGEETGAGAESVQPGAEAEQPAIEQDVENSV